MKNHFELIILSLVTSFVFFRPIFAEEILDSHSIKLFWVYPMTLSHGADRSWFELRKCEPEDEKKCNETILKIPFSDLKTNGEFKVEIDAYSVVKLSFISDSKKEPLVVASEKRVQGWFPAVEACSIDNPKLDCQYKIFRSPESQSISVQLLQRN